MSERTFYNWKAKYGGMTVSGAERLKKLLAEQMPDAAAMKELPAKNGEARREVRSRCAPAGQNGSVRTSTARQVIVCNHREGACRIVRADRKMIRYRSRRSPDTELRQRLHDLTSKRRRFGFRRLFVLLRRQGEPSGINRIYRLYHEEGLAMRRHRARRKAAGRRAPILVEARN